MTEDEILPSELLEKLRRRGEKIVTAESCTAGLVAHLLASVPGASDVFWGSLITYTAGAKMKLLGIPEKTLTESGEVSPETACAMAKGALEKSGVDIAVSVTGLAGPSGDNSDTPVGTVWIGMAYKGRNAEAKSFFFRLDRNELRKKAAEKALDEISLYIDRI